MNINIDEIIEKYNNLSKACNVAFPKNQTYKQISDWLVQLKKYQELELAGKLVKLNCEIGDKIWYVDEDDDDYPIELEIDTLGISRDNNDNKCIWYYAYDNDSNKYGFIDNDFGETIFLTKEEADMKLKEITEAR